VKKRYFAIVDGTGKDLVAYALDYYPEEMAAYKREMGDATPSRRRFVAERR
jgi:hypothetical protein